MGALGREHIAANEILPALIPSVKAGR